MIQTSQRFRSLGRCPWEQARYRNGPAFPVFMITTRKELQGIKDPATRLREGNTPVLRYFPGILPSFLFPPLVTSNCICPSSPNPAPSSGTKEWAFWRNSLPYNQKDGRWMGGGGEPCLYFHGLSQQNQEPSWLIFLLLIFPHTIFFSQICFHYFRNIFQIHCAFISQVILPSVTLHTSRALQQNVPLSDSLLLITASRFCLL